MSVINEYIYTKLQQSSALVALVGDRIYANQIPQLIDKPAIVSTVISTVPTNSKSGVSTLDTIRVEIAIIVTAFGTVDATQRGNEIAELVRSELDFTQNSTLASNTIQLIRFDSQTDFFDPNAGTKGAIIIYQNYFLYKQR